MAEKNDERRKFKRLDARVTVEIKSYDTDKSETVVYASETKDLSAGGVKIVADAAFPVPHYVLVKFSIPDEAPVEYFAKVVRVEEISDKGPYEIGLWFLHMTSEQKAALDRFVMKNK